MAHAEAAEAGGEHTLVRTASGAVLSAGACGLGWCREVAGALGPALFGWRAVPLPEPASAIHASYYHNLALGARTGTLYSWGCGTFVGGNMDGVIPALGPADCGEGDRDGGRPDRGGAPQPVALPQTSAASAAERAVALSGGAYHSVLLTSGGRVLTFGAGQLGQLGRSLGGAAAGDDGDASGGSSSASSDGAGLPVDARPAPVEGLDAADEVRAIGAGFYNTLAACASGKLFCAGENQNEQCGRGAANLRTMVEVAELRGTAVAAACGGYCHTLALTRGGEVVTMGCGDEGQRGDGVAEDDAAARGGRATVSRVALPCRAAAMAAGANHSVVLGEDGVAYGFGSNEYGQLGQPPAAHSGSGSGGGGDDDDDDDDDTCVLAPARITLPPGAGRVVSVSAGYNHTVLRDEHGAVFALGQNENGQLGLGGVCGAQTAAAATPQRCPIDE